MSIILIENMVVTMNFLYKVTFFESDVSIATSFRKMLHRDAAIRPSGRQVEFWGITHRFPGHNS